MLNTRDIYFKVDTQIVEKGFWTIDDISKKQLVEDELKNYTIDKLKQVFSNHKNINNELSLYELLNQLDECLITIEDKNEFFRHYTHYILNIASGMQGFAIVWYQEENKKLIKKPFGEISENNIWDSVKTHQETAPINTTLFVLDIFKNHFMVKTKGKQKVKK